MAVDKSSSESGALTHDRRSVLGQSSTLETPLDRPMNRFRLGRITLRHHGLSSLESKVVIAGCKSKRRLILFFPSSKYSLKSANERVRMYCAYVFFARRFPFIFIDEVRILCFERNHYDFYRL